MPVTPRDSAEIRIIPTLNRIDSPYLYVTAAFFLAPALEDFAILTILAHNLAIRRYILVETALRTSSYKSSREIMSIWAKRSGRIRIRFEDFSFSENSLTSEAS